MNLTVNNFDARLRLLKIKAGADTALDNLFRESAKNLQDEAKRNAPWTDRTGNARRTLKGETLCFHFGIKSVHIIGRMFYSPNLELEYGGRYSILFPTLLQNYKSILHSAVKAVEGVEL